MATTPNAAGSACEDSVGAVLRHRGIAIVKPGPMKASVAAAGRWAIAHPKTLNFEGEKARSGDFCILARPGHYDRDAFPGLRSTDTLCLFIEVRAQAVSGSAEDKVFHALNLMKECDTLATGEVITHTALVLHGDGFSKSFHRRMGLIYGEGLRVRNRRGTDLVIRADLAREAVSTIQDLSAFLAVSIGTATERKRARARGGASRLFG